jgi:hypothetical protein
VARDDRRRKEVFGRLVAPDVRAVAGERRSTTAWGRGGRGEEVVGISLNRAIGGDGFVLHDRSIPGTRSNIDHIAVVPSGIWVIDTKRYSGLVEQRDLGGWFTSRPALFVNGRNRTPLIPAVVRQMARIGEIVGTAMPVHGVLCFTEAEWRPLGRPFTIDHVTVTSERRSRRSGAWQGHCGVPAHSIQSIFEHWRRNSPQPSPATGRNRLSGTGAIRVTPVNRTERNLVASKEVG